MKKMFILGFSLLGLNACVTTPISMPPSYMSPPEYRPFTVPSSYSVMTPSYPIYTPTPTHTYIHPPRRPCFNQHMQPPIYHYSTPIYSSGIARYQSKNGRYDVSVSW